MRNGNMATRQSGIRNELKLQTKQDGRSSGTYDMAERSPRRSDPDLALFVKPGQAWSNLVKAKKGV